MWVARDRDGKLRLFQSIPRRYHEGPGLSSDKVGFNDAVTIGDDEYSFWAIQKFYKSNIIDPDCHGILFYKSTDREGVTASYGHEVFRDLTWEHEPIEVEVVARDKGELVDIRSIENRAECCAVNLYLNPEVYNEDKAEAYEKGFIHGAETQRLVDIDKAYKLFSDRIALWNIQHQGKLAFDYEDFRKMMLKGKE